MSEAKKQSGHYLYSLNGERAPVEEFWSRETLADGRQCITSGRRAGAVAVDVNAMEFGGRIQSFSAQWREEGGRELLVEYALQDQSLCVEHTEGVAIQAEVFDCSQRPALLFPLMRIYTGPLIEALLVAGGSACVILPEIGVESGSAQLFKPRFSERHAEFVATEILQDASGKPRTCKRCLYLGDQYEKDASFWVGEDNLLERYQWRQDESRLWDVVISRDD